MEPGPTAHFRTLSALCGPKATSIAFAYFHLRKINGPHLPPSHSQQRCHPGPHSSPELHAQVTSHLLSNSPTGSQTKPAWKFGSALSRPLMSSPEHREVLHPLWKSLPPLLTSGTSKYFSSSNLICNPSLRKQPYSLQCMVPMQTSVCCPLLKFLQHLFHLKYPFKKPLPK